MKFTPERALIVKRTAVIADLHLGLENALIEKGIAIPKVQLEDIIERLRNLPKIERVVIAGDLKHEFGRNLPYEWEDVEVLLKFLLKEGLDVVVVRGNHDNFLGAILSKFGLNLLDRYDLEGWTVVHGHKDCDAKRIIMGHEHPAIKIRIDGVYTFHCFLRIRTEREVIVLPAFSPLVSGSDVSSCRFLSPILSNVKCEDVEVYAVDEEVFYLGTLGDLKEIVKSQELF